MLAAENGTNSPFAAPQRFRPESRGQLTLGGRRWAARRTAGDAHNRREIVEEAFAAKENIGNFALTVADPHLLRHGRRDCLHGLFQVLRGAEGDLLAGLDLDGLAGSRVAAHTGGTFAHLQDAEATDSDALALL